MTRSRISLPVSAVVAALAGLPAATGRAAPASTPPIDHLDRHLGPAIGFDEAVLDSDHASTLLELDVAVRDKRHADETLPSLSFNPQLQVMPGARVPPASDAGFEIQTNLSQSWNLDGYAHKRKAAARAETEVLAAEVRAIALEQRLGAARAWIRLHAAESRLALAEQELRVDQELVSALEQARAAGVATRVDVAEARALAADAQGVVTSLAGQVHDLGLELARETGIRASAPLRTRGPYPDPQLPDEVELRRRFEDLEALPAVALHRLQARAALARAEEAKASAGTKLTTGVSIQRESNRDVVLFGMVGLTVPVFDGNQREQASARAQARRSGIQAERLEVELSAQIQVALHDLHHTEEQLVTLRDQSLPALDELVAARELALDLGEGTRPRLLRARHQRSAVARDVATAEADWVASRVQVWLFLQAIESAESTR